MTLLWWAEIYGQRLWLTPKDWMQILPCCMFDCIHCMVLLFMLRPSPTMASTVTAKHFPLPGHE